MHQDTSLPHCSGSLEDSSLKEEMKGKAKGGKEGRQKIAYFKNSSVLFLPYNWKNTEDIHDRVQYNSCLLWSMLQSRIYLRVLQAELTKWGSHEKEL